MPGGKGCVPHANEVLGTNRCNPFGKYAELEVGAQDYNKRRYYHGPNSEKVTLEMECDRVND